MAGSVQRRAIYFSGMVQGVGFRYTTHRIARQFLITGFVQNLRDGRVLITVQGMSGEIDRFLEAVDSELGYYVTGSDTDFLEPANDFASFEIRF